MGNRRKMEIGDWFNAASLMAVGFFMGLALDGLLQLDGPAFWILAVGMPIVFWGLIAVAGLVDGLIDRIFPGGVKPARAPQPKERKPLVVLLSVPAGVVFGLVGAQFGLGDLIP